MIKMIKQGGAYNSPVQAFIMDSSSEVSDLPTNVPQGSTAFAIDDGSEYILNGMKEWKAKLDTGRDLVLLDLSKKYTDDSILGVDGILVGDSAYESAVANGYQGTIQEWLVDLHGHEARIDAVTKTWFTYDPTLETYVDTSITAEGKDGIDGISGEIPLKAGFDAGAIKLVIEEYRKFAEEWVGTLDLTFLDNIETVEFNDAVTYANEVGELLIDFILDNFEELDGGIVDFFTEAELEARQAVVTGAATVEGVVLELGTIYQGLIEEELEEKNPLKGLYDYQVGEFLARLAFVAFKNGDLPYLEIEEEEE